MGEIKLALTFFGDLPDEILSTSEEDLPLIVATRWKDAVVFVTVSNKI